VVEYCISFAIQSFLRDHRKLKFYVNTLLQVRLGNSFPEMGVGMNWTARFLDQHSQRLSTFF
ncbi:hypothetical protein BS17DRAFT_654935, partial [Gyrodon lividus]